VAGFAVGLARVRRDARQIGRETGSWPSSPRRIAI
jgi:hypothetical protein